MATTQESLEKETAKKIALAEELDTQKKKLFESNKQIEEITAKLEGLDRTMQKTVNSHKAEVAKLENGLAVAVTEKERLTQEVNSKSSTALF